MHYTMEFNEKCTVPEILLQLPWADHSWHNEVCPSFHNVCPSFHNETLKVMVWVDFDNIEDREYDTEKRLIVQELIPRENDEPDIGTTLFETDNQNALQRWLYLYEVKLHLERAIDSVNESITLEDIIADDLQSLIARLDEQMNNLH